MKADRKPQLMAEKCPTCIFRPGDPMHLGARRLADIIEQNRAKGTALICHSTLEYGQYPEVGRAVCRGYYDAYPDTSVLQVVERLGGFAEVRLPDER